MSLDLAPEILISLGTVLILVVVNVLLGAVSGWKGGYFTWQALAGFLDSAILRQVAGLLVLALAAPLLPGLKELFLISAAASAAKYLADIKDKLVALFG